MEDPVFMTVLDGGKHLEKCVADPIILRSIVVGSDRGVKVAAAVKVEDENVAGKAAVDALATKVDVGIKGDCVGNVFVILDFLLHGELIF